MSSLRRLTPRIKPSTRYDDPLVRALTKAAEATNDLMLKLWARRLLAEGEGAASQPADAEAAEVRP